MIYVTSDIHGDYIHFFKMMEKIRLSSEDRLYILGDAVDKGKENLRVLRYIYDSENICLIKPLILNKKIFKEKQFVLRLENNQLVQGVVDLFAMGDENILIDYKFTRENDENILKNRYKMQLLLYKQAIEKAKNIKIDKVYLISLLNKKIIIF